MNDKYPVTNNRTIIKCIEEKKYSMIKGLGKMMQKKGWILENQLSDPTKSLKSNFSKVGNMIFFC